MDLDCNCKAVQTRARQCESFDKALTRQQHAASMRHSGPEAIRTSKVLSLADSHRPLNGPFLEGPFSTMVDCPKTAR